MNTTDPTLDQVNLLHEQVRQYLSQGYTDSQIVQLMREKNVDANYTQVLLENIAADRSKRKKFLYTLCLGSFLLVGGIILNILSYRIAANTGSFVFYLFWGILAAGVVTIAQAFILFRK